jgi:hypothetical protein
MPRTFIESLLGLKGRGGILPQYIKADGSWVPPVGSGKKSNFPERPGRCLHLVPKLELGNQERGVDVSGKAGKNAGLARTTR